LVRRLEGLEQGRGRSGLSNQQGRGLGGFLQIEGDPISSGVLKKEKKRGAEKVLDLLRGAKRAAFVCDRSGVAGGLEKGENLGASTNQDIYLGKGFPLLRKPPL